MQELRGVSIFLGWLLPLGLISALAAPQVSSPQAVSSLWP